MIKSGVKIIIIAIAWRGYFNIITYPVFSNMVWAVYLLHFFIWFYSFFTSLSPGQGFEIG